MSGSKPKAKAASGLSSGPPRIAFKGLLHVAYNRKRQTYIARSWPSSNGGDTEARNLRILQFKEMVAACKAARAEERSEALKLARGTQFTWRDVWQMSYKGRLISWTDENNKFWMGWTMANEITQVLLDSIYNQPGGMLLRGPTGWIMLLPPSAQKVLVYDPTQGAPQWADVPVNIQTALDAISNTPGDLLIRGTSSWGAIAASDLVDVQDLLDALGSAEGDMLVRSGTAWSVLSPGPTGYALVANGAGAMPSYQAVTGSGGGSTDIFSPPQASTFGTVLNGGSGTPAPTLTVAAGYPSSLDMGPAMSIPPLRALIKTPVNTSAPTWSARFRATGMQNTANCATGLVATDGTKSTLLVRNANGNVLWYTMTSLQQSPTITTLLPGDALTNDAYLRIQVSGSNFLAYASNDGLNWTQIGSIASNLTSALKIGVGGTCGGSLSTPRQLMALYWWEEH